MCILTKRSRSVCCGELPSACCPIAIAPNCGSCCVDRGAHIGDTFGPSALGSILGLCYFDQQRERLGQLMYRNRPSVPLEVFSHASVVGGSVLITEIEFTFSDIARMALSG